MRARWLRVCIPWLLHIHHSFCVGRVVLFVEDVPRVLALNSLEVIFMSLGEKVAAVALLAVFILMATISVALNSVIVYRTTPKTPDIRYACGCGPKCGCCENCEHCRKQKLGELRVDTTTTTVRPSGAKE